MNIMMLFFPEQLCDLISSACDVSMILTLDNNQDRILDLLNIV